MYTLEEIRLIVLNTLLETGVNRLPVDIGYWYKRKGWRCYTYSHAKRNGISVDHAQRCVTVKSEEGLTVYYDDTVRPVGRIRWTLAYEGARIVLGPDSTNREADYFAEQFLMPVAPLVFLGVKTADDIMLTCQVTRDVAYRRAEDLIYRETYGDSAGYEELDWAVLRQFGMQK